MANPMYRQIADDLREQIESGALVPGSQLPTELELRERYSASRNTVRDAIKWLTNLGLIQTRPGQGTFITELKTPFVTTLSGDPLTGLGGGEGGTFKAEVSAARRLLTNSPVQVEIQNATGEIAARLRIPENTEVVLRHERRFIDGTPYSMQTSYYPMDLVIRGAKDLQRARNIEQGTVTYLREVLGIAQIGYRDWITVRAPNATEADFFNLSPDRVAIFEVFRTAFDGNQIPMRLTVTVYPTDRNQFIFNIGSVPPPHNAPAGDGDEDI
jgi:DNA-binding GntR family transcriptional regulator